MKFFLQRILYTSIFSISGAEALRKHILHLPPVYSYKHRPITDRYEHLGSYQQVLCKKFANQYSTFQVSNIFCIRFC